MSSQAVEALKKIHIEVEKVIQSMQDKDWELQSLCEGWRVQEVFAHMSSNMKEAINRSKSDGSKNMTLFVATIGESVFSAISSSILLYLSSNSWFVLCISINILLLKKDFRVL